MKIPSATSILVAIQIMGLIAFAGAWFEKQGESNTKLVLLVEKVSGLENLIDRADTQVILQGEETRKQQRKILRLYNILHKRITRNENFLRKKHPEFGQIVIPSFYDDFAPN